LQVTSATEKYGLPDTQKQPVKSIDKDAFLKLFIEQLKNQDPMSPQDTNAFTAQMAQFSMLEQLTNLNTEMTQLRRSQEMGEASALLGRQVKVQSGDTLISGKVEKVALVDKVVQVYVNGTGYGLSQITEVK
jgi:flagellar basal-body rod modification protein FlgD